MLKSTTEIRRKFLDFFAKKHHKIISSSSLIPKNDNSLLFTNSGMNQFKEIFLGKKIYPYNCVATSQKCLRVGGKHNDLDNVGYNTRHLTFFEMLGNFSFGSYFKEKSILYAWELLTSNEWFNISKEKLWITVYDKDEESYNIWNNIVGVDHNRIIPIGDYNKKKPYLSDNFWYISDTGPCGPCSEIFYDHGSKMIGNIPGKNKDTGDRYVEIWNLVFMQFYRHKDGKLSNLPKLSIDTGMGLERITAVLQNVNSSYDIDIFQKIKQSIIAMFKIHTRDNNSLNVIVDHIRACIFMILDGIIPGNESRSYILRKIIRRAIFHGKKLGIQNYFLSKLVGPVLNIIKNDLKYNKNQENLIIEILFKEETQFNNTLSYGLSLLNKEIKKIRNNVLSGKIAFKLYDTYGFPLDLTYDICKSNNIKVDISNFNILMKKQKELSKALS